MNYVQELLMSFVQRPEVWAFLVFGIVATLRALGIWFEGVRYQKFKDIVAIAYGAVEEYARRHPSSKLDKTKLFLEKLRELASAEHIPLTTARENEACAMADAIHDAEKKKEGSQ